MRPAFIPICHKGHAVKPDERTLSITVFGDEPKRLTTA